MNILERKIDLAHTDLVNEGKRVTTEMLKNKYLGIEEKPHNLVVAFQDHNDKVEALFR